MGHPVEPSAAPGRRGLTAMEAARYLGVSTQTLNRRVQSGDVPPPKTIAGAKRYDRVELVD